LSMFLFSIGTVPLMFAFGALSSLLSKKFTSKMMTASAVLVVVLGIFMFNNGMGSSGIILPGFSTTTSIAKAANIASIEDNVQVVTSGLSSGQYEAIVVQKGIPVKWTIQAEEGEINGCNGSIIVQKYGIQKELKVGDNVIEFTPTESGTVPYSCWMGMIRSKITVVDDLSNIESSALKDDSSTSSAGASCCGSGSGSSSGNSASSSVDYDQLQKAKIPTDTIAVAEVKDGVQYVDITYDDNGFSPAVVVMQSGLDTKWVINGKKFDGSKGALIFPDYNAKLKMVEGENPIAFTPQQDFSFFTEDGTYLGYVKVVEDINNIDTTAIKKEASEYNPLTTN
ncbi:MAG: sulfite exporter TauE/SafE family protein, partial [Herbinix sp.]|nr:sulfite exporter TauE/SafE family protein [Herbinix sp.]